MVIGKSGGTFISFNHYGAWMPLSTSITYLYCIFILTHLFTFVNNFMSFQISLESFIFYFPYRYYRIFLFFICSIQFQYYYYIFIILFLFNFNSTKLLYCLSKMLTVVKKLFVLLLKIMYNENCLEKVTNLSNENVLHIQKENM